MVSDNSSYHLSPYNVITILLSIFPMLYITSPNYLIYNWKTIYIYSMEYIYIFHVLLIAHNAAMNIGVHVSCMLVLYLIF